MVKPEIRPRRTVRRTVGQDSPGAVNPPVDLLLDQLVENIDPHNIFEWDKLCVQIS
jgi:hypothetical protein